MNIFYERDENTTDNVEYTSIDNLLNNDNEFRSIMDTSSIHLITNIHDDTPLASTSENSTSFQSVDND
jgi:hypothetical protein